MKYWRGYLVAGIVAILTWALTQFASAHGRLLDMIYPYVTRLVQTSLAQWSSGVDYCLWQVLFLFGIGAILASVVLMVALRWNPIQWFGWVLAAVCFVNLVNTGLYALNVRTNSIADDMHISTADYSISALEEATVYYLETANELSSKVMRTKDGGMKKLEFYKLSEQAADGFTTLVKVNHYPVFAGSTLPVKKLDWTDEGVTGKTVGLTGEAAVNPNVPAAGMPFAMCKEMAKRMSIASEGDSNFAAYMACAANSDATFQYSGWLMAFRSCYNALKRESSASAKAALQRVENLMSKQVKTDLKAYNSFLGDKAGKAHNPTVNLFVNWHIETVVLPIQEAADAEADPLFDPLDENDPRLSGLLGNS